jgi:2-oxoglutarate ferredoxin oxidoreductase subunit alpha
VRWAGEQLGDADLVVVAYGTAARVARTAIERVREVGLRAGLFRPITLWPFPSHALAEAAEHARGVLVVELSAGQMVEDVRLAIEGRQPVMFSGRTGGMVPTPGEVADALRRLYALTPDIAMRDDHAEEMVELGGGELEGDPLALLWAGFKPAVHEEADR